ncbi:CoA transferase [Variovorax sp. Sphag1AA]|uniref:CaiB/BaiF CoA transferase family protein n=1 Tax=Variovorax sp. Sphag1AA TaxID=2587027 RepID=UPI001819C243|nr:CoA transferase [Variovorax sp. Sphag1AA]MBB3182074.1 crotonobetainyl-CoA:carnitine CoA-transferase CaiB-like acyl-CoA transferase [Variovorax sp. Sphag1AA]
MPTTHKPQGALHGVRILDMATVLAAPLGATLCADHGADVVKLELPDGSDALRGLQPVKDGVPLWWKVANRGKQGITLDVRTPKGRELLLSMLPEFDVLVENFRTGTMARWGLDTETLHRANPRLIVIRLTGFGQTGPYRERPGFARIFEAMSGFTNLTGEAGGPPLHSNYPIGDYIAGLFCAFAIAMEVARLRGDPDAPGTEVDLAATEALFRLLDPLPVEHEQMDYVRGPSGNRASYTAPSNMYRSRDGVWLSLVASSNAIFARTCDVVGLSGWATDPRFATNPARVQNLDELDGALGRWFAAHDYADIAGKLEAGGIPFSKVYSIEDIRSDPHFAERGAIVRMADPELGSVPGPCIVPRVVGHEPAIPRTGPSPGEHNETVYARFGIGPQELARLREQKVI